MYCDYICETGEHAFGKTKTTPQAIHDLIVDKEPERVVMEICSISQARWDAKDASAARAIRF